VVDRVGLHVRGVGVGMGFCVGKRVFVNAYYIGAGHSSRAV
jgi:hypothetical protein